MRRVLKFQRQVLAICIDEPRLAIYRLCYAVLSAGFDMHCPNAMAVTEGANLGEGGFAKSLTPEGEPDEEVVHRGGEAAVFHAIAERQHHIADVEGGSLNKPHMAQP